MCNACNLLKMLDNYVSISINFSILQVGFNSFCRIDVFFLICSILEMLMKAITMENRCLLNSIYMSGIITVILKEIWSFINAYCIAFQFRMGKQLRITQNETQNNSLELLCMCWSARVININKSIRLRCNVSFHFDIMYLAHI